VIGLLIVTHADLAGELLRAAEMIVGSIPSARGVAVCREEGVEVLSRRVRDACSEVAADGHGVIIMTDMFGGTPTNLSLPLLDKFDAEIVCGVNLPMVLKFINSREAGSVAALARELRNYAAEKISVVSDVLAETGRARP